MFKPESGESESASKEWTSFKLLPHSPVALYAHIPAWMQVFTNNFGSMGHISFVFYITYSDSCLFLDVFRPAVCFWMFLDLLYIIGQQYTAITQQSKGTNVFILGLF